MGSVKGPLLQRREASIVIAPTVGCGFRSGCTDPKLGGGVNHRSTHSGNEQEHEHEHEHEPKPSPVLHRITSLPSELQIDILRIACRDQSTAHALALVSQRLNQLCTPFLYAHITLLTPLSTRLLTRAFALRPALAGYVMSLGAHDNEQYEWERRFEEPDERSFVLPQNARWNALRDLALEAEPVNVYGMLDHLVLPWHEEPRYGHGRLRNPRTKRTPALAQRETPLRALTLHVSSRTQLSFLPNLLIHPALAQLSHLTLDLAHPIRPLTLPCAAIRALPSLRHLALTGLPCSADHDLGVFGAALRGVFTGTDDEGEIGYSRLAGRAAAADESSLVPDRSNALSQLEGVHIGLRTDWSKPLSPRAGATQDPNETSWRQSQRAVLTRARACFEAGLALHGGSARATEAEKEDPVAGAGTSWLGHVRIDYVLEGPWEGGWFERWERTKM